MKKSLIIKLLFCIIILIFVASVSCFATYTYFANNISYGSTTVENALNNLYTIKGNNNNYSTDEQVIGKWIDGKNIYRKTYYVETIPTQTWYTIVQTNNITALNIDSIIEFKGSAIKKQTFEHVNMQSYLNSTVFSYLNLTSTDGIKTYSTGFGDLSKCIIILEYTKTTD